MTGSSLLETAGIISGLRSGRLDLHAHLQDLESRFSEVEPTVQAFIPESGRFERLRDQAGVLLERFPDPRQRPLLFGVPIGVKDIFHVAGLPTRAGSRLPAEVLQGEQARVVTDLLQQGALIVGKTVTTEFAYFAPGPTRNPHNPEHTPGGSSSGSAAAVAAGLCSAALGTQTIGSINRPAAFCGVVGFKPTYGQVSAAGVIPLAPSLDHVGFFTRGMGGMLHVAEAVLAGWTPIGELPAPQLAIPMGPYLDRLTEVGATHFWRAVERLRDQGFQITELEVMPDFDQIVERHQKILAFEAAQTHEDWFDAHRQLYHERTANLIESGRSTDPEEVRSSILGRGELNRALAGVMDDYSFDLWITPSAPGPAPPGLDATGDPVMNLPWTHTGMPTLTIPSSVDEDGLPLAVQLVGRGQADENLLVWGTSIEATLRRIGIGVKSG